MANTVQAEALSPASSPATTLSRRAKPWRNWSGAVQFSPQHVAAPTSVGELQGIVRDVAARGGQLRVAGSGHSFTPLVQTDDTLLTLNGLSGIERIDGHVARIRAGTSLKDLGPELARRGFGMTNLGDINKQALAGAVSTGTHGTGQQLGSISSQVRGMELVLASGERMRCSATENANVFDAARVSLGALGVISSVDIELQPAYRLKLTKRAMDLDDCLAQAPDFARLYRHFEFYWIPHTRQTLVKLMDWTAEPESAQGMTTAVELVLENGAFGLISRLARYNPQWAPKLAQVMAYATKGDQSTMVADCHRAFSTARLVRFQEMEYELPAENGADALRELAEYIERHRVLVHFPVEYRYVAADDIWLSPFYQRDAVSISVHQYVGMEHQAYFAAAESIFRNHGGRPHWGKIHSLAARELRELYPRWDDFQRVRRQLDPKGLFSNALLRRWFGD
ncbi:L-gulonolactone oxidase [Hydrocarboniphaga daqingensis]|uniref:L-gulonolactone oxidase n=1 Tax=Hydrocarboniphaga daqingensis TaxID=490188 RepID=A0A1M5NQE2_9GAMM|nr:D-arabinono-1,4-lactone oxidase [Hydrocarboniphaga daqingensis]SHG91730.1 L-gulonolactone oxidase [Hydrocarboniphaga daqingensis]